nr:hypothetical protein [Tanacetum cinerariifolium]GEZ61023.1 hypothetical protein [Tanacetum cinerariifolium]
MILESVEHGPLIWPTVEENGVIRTKKYAELSAAEKIQADCDIKDTNIILQGLPADIYSLVNHHKGESLHTYYLRFTQMNNNMNIYKMNMEQFQVNTKFLNSLPPEWSKFVTDLKLVKDLHTSNYDQLHAYIEQHELHANEVRLMHSGFDVPVFSLRDDLIACLNKAMAFLTVVSSSRQCTQPKRPRNVAWYKEKAMLAEAQEAGQILDEEQLVFLADPGIPAGQGQTIIPYNAAFQTEDLDTYDSDFDDLSNTQAVLMTNISNYGFDVISEETLQDTNLQAQQDSMIISVIEKMKCFVPQQELSADEAFWYHMLNPSTKSSVALTVKIEAPKELLKVSLVNESLKKLKLDLANFDEVMKIMTTPNARTKGE